MLYHLLMTIHIIACLLMILVVLLQTGRGAGLMVFGGGGDSLINTPSGSNFMKTFTSVLAGTFAFTSLFLTLLHSRSSMSSVMSRVKDEPAPVAAPAAPAAPAPVAPAANKPVEPPNAPETPGPKK